MGGTQGRPSQQHSTATNKRRSRKVAGPAQETAIDGKVLRVEHDRWRRTLMVPADDNRLPPDVDKHTGIMISKRQHTDINTVGIRDNWSESQTVCQPKAWLDGTAFELALDGDETGPPPPVDSSCAHGPYV